VRHARHAAVSHAAAEHRGEPRGGAAARPERTWPVVRMMALTEDWIIVMQHSVVDVV
jgi:hypothetical protein